jgi:hypothetical protein
MVYGSGQREPTSKDTHEVWEHHFIGIWEAPMLSFMKDNPEAVAWLQLEEEPELESKKKPGAIGSKA